MAKYHVRVAYVTKLGGFDVGMEVDAFGPDEATKIAKDKILKGHKARRLAYTIVEEVRP